MRIFLSFILVMLSVQLACSQRISRTYNDVSLSDALKDIGSASKRYDISFIYNELEDYRVTARISKRTIPEAVSDIVGFYPIRITIADSTIVVESMKKSEYHIKGKVVDEGGKPVAYANIALLTPSDSAVVGNGISNESGVFVIPADHVNLIARISYVGSKTVYRHCRAENIGTVVLMRDNYMLKGVTVRGQNTIVRAENGHLVYNMPQLMKILPADNAYEALKRIPGVVDMGDGKITFTGHAVTLMIDGKPTTLSAEHMVERLKSMPASALAKVEIMTAAPAKYHARGMVFNILTKDFAGSNQLSGQLHGTWEQDKYGKVYAKGAVLYNRGRVGIDAYYDITYGDSYGKVEHEANHPLADGRMFYTDRTENKSFGYNHSCRIGVDYDVAKDSRASVAYTGQWSSTDVVNTTRGTVRSVQKSWQHDRLHNVDASFSSPIGLQVGFSYTNYQNPRTQNLNGTMYGEERLLFVDSRQKISKCLFTADQTHTLKNNWRLDYGVKAQFTRNKSYQTTLNSDNTLIADATSSVDYSERITNVYAGFGKQIGNRLSFEGSLDGEHYRATKWNEWRFYPTFSIMWNADKDNIFNLSLSSEAVYPSYWSTMSDIYYSSSYSEIWGNPDLRPMSEYTLNMMWQLKGKYTFRAFAMWEPDYFVQLAYQPADRMAVVMKMTNFDYMNIYGLQCSAQFGIGSWLNGNVFATGILRHDKSSSFFDLPFDRRQLTAIVGGNVSVRFSERNNITLMLTPFFQSRAIQGIYDIEPIFRLNAQLRWTSNNGKWTVIANGDNITNGHATTRSVCGNQDYMMRVWMMNPGGALSLIYRIGGFKEKKTKAVDMSRMGY